MTKEWKDMVKHLITKIMASSPITSWELDGETVETVSVYFSLKQNQSWKNLKLLGAKLTGLWAGLKFVGRL